jgi:peptidoglycan/LPS O-acetylase OafA/YrhL
MSCTNVTTDPVSPVEPLVAPQPQDLGKVVSPRKSSRYGSLDLWRGVACLAVVIYHATMQVVPTLTPGETFGSRLGYSLVHATGILWVGVPMFFVISGYCIFATLEKSVARGDSLGAYFFRRFRRIYPPYWIALALCGGLIIITEMAISPGLLTNGIFTIVHPLALDASQWLGNVTLTESWREHAFGSSTSFILPHVWTLCYEEQFYAVAGLILLIAPRRMFAASVVVSIVVAATMVLSKKLGFSVEGLFLDGRWLLFAAGILVYYAVNHAGTRTRLGISIALATALVVMLATGSVPWEYYLNRSLERFTAIAFALTLILLYRFDKQICSARWLTPLFICGTMCYSLYLTHVLVTKSIGYSLFRMGMHGPWETLLLAVPLSILFSTAIGWIFYLAVERRFLNR